MLLKPLTTAVCVSLLLVGSAAAQSAKEDSEGRGPGVYSLLPPLATTTHTINIDSKQLVYTAKVDALPLLRADAKPTARIFYVAYDLTAESGNRPPADRPVTFVFNGGPGAASAYLHLGALGPRILKTSPEGAFLAPPQRLADNPDTWLGVTDLVFVDPVGTGYSRAAPDVKAESFWGVDQDAEAMAAFIRLYLQNVGRTQNPIYLVGESYGGFRAALLAKVLQEEAGVTPTGIVLISPALELSFVYGDGYHPLNWALLLPSMAAVRLEDAGVPLPEMEERLAGVEHYALTGYVTALASGLETGGKEASGEVAKATGLPLDFVKEHHARISPTDFIREFKRANGLKLSLYDGTIVTADLAPASSFDQTPDPVLDRSVPVLTSAFVHYVRSELNYHTDISYRLLNREVSVKWNYGKRHSKQGYAGVLDELQEARSLNPDLKILIAHGYTDLVTPYLMSRYLIGQLPDLPGAAPIGLTNYRGGHMMYLRPDTRRQLRIDAAGYYRDPS